MKIEKIKEKYLCEIKWGVYYYVSSVALNIINILFYIFIFNSRPDLIYAYVFLFLTLITYLGFSVICIIEINRLKGFGFFSKLASMMNILFFGFIFNSFISFSHSDFIIPKKEIEVQVITEKREVMCYY